MISGIKYIELVKLYFSFLNTEFGYILSKETENGNAFYNVEYSNNERVISISYENIEDYFLVIVFILENGKLPDYDDKMHTLHLEELNKRILSKINQRELEANNVLFEHFSPKNEFEKKLIKSAKELRIALMHWQLVTFEK